MLEKLFPYEIFFSPKMPLESKSQIEMNNSPQIQCKIVMFMLELHKNIELLTFQETGAKIKELTMLESI